jgi:hypothetical protein
MKFYDLVKAVHFHAARVIRTLVPSFVLGRWKFGAPDEMQRGIAMSLLRLLISETPF